MILYPKEYFNNVREIDIDFLRKNKINALILDVDNTLIDYDKNLAEETIRWAENLKEEGIKLYILSKLVGNTATFGRVWTDAFAFSETTTLLPSNGSPQFEQNLSLICNTALHLAHFNSVPLTWSGKGVVGGVEVVLITWLLLLLIWVLVIAAHIGTTIKPPTKTAKKSIPAIAGVTKKSQ